MSLLEAIAQISKNRAESPVVCEQTVLFMITSEASSFSSTKNEQTLSELIFSILRQTCEAFSFLIFLGVPLLTGETFQAIA